MNRIHIAVAACILTASTAAHADTRMIFDTGRGGASHFSIKGDRIRMEGGDNGDMVTLFDASENRLTLIEPSEQSYYHMDPETVQRQSEQMSEQMQQMRKQMEEQMENLPEEQQEAMREQMEQMMPENAAPEEPPADMRLERSGERATVAGIECEQVTVHGDGKPIHRACVASADAIGMPRADMETLQSMFDMFKEMAVGFGGDQAGAHAPARLIEEMDGIPIQAEDLEGDASWTLQDVRSDNLDADHFEIPAGYQEVNPFESMEQMQ